MALEMRHKVYAEQAESPTFKSIEVAAEVDFIWYKVTSYLIQITIVFNGWETMSNLNDSGYPKITGQVSSPKAIHNFSLTEQVCDLIYWAAIEGLTSDRQWHCHIAQVMVNAVVVSFLLEEISRETRVWFRLDFRSKDSSQPQSCDWQSYRKFEHNAHILTELICREQKSGSYEHVHDDHGAKAGSCGYYMIALR